MKPRVSVAQALVTLGRPVFTTREIAAIRGASVSSTTQVLSRLEKEKVLVRASRGVWCIPSDPRFTPFALVGVLAGRHRAYVSFFSALHLHGLTGQIPQMIFAATTAHTRITRTPVAAYSFHRIQPGFFVGFDWHPSREFLVATPEKALVDCLYVSGRKAKRFGFLPELELPKSFRFRVARDWANRIGEPRVRTYVLKKLKELSARVRAVGS